MKGGSITKRGTKTYEISVQTGKDERGKYQRKTRTIHGTKADACKALAEMQTERTNAPAFAQFAREWLTMRKASGEWSAKTQKQYEWLVGCLAEELDVTLDKVDARKVSAAYIRMKNAHGWSNTTLHKAHLALKQILDAAADDGLIAANPLDRMKAPKNDRVKRKSLTPEDFARLEACLDAARQTPYVLAARIGLATGMRRGEVLGLAWGDVDLEHERLTVSQVYTTHGLTAPKTATSARTIAINASLIDKLRAVKPDGAKPDTPVCAAKTGGFINPDHFERWWRKFRRDNGFEDLKFHELRHTQATLLLAAGTDLKTVQARLGHADASMTLNFYAHSVPGNDRRAAESVEGMLAKNGR